MHYYWIFVSLVCYQRITPDWHYFHHVSDYSQFFLMDLGHLTFRMEQVKLSCRVGAIVRMYHLLLVLSS